MNLTGRQKSKVLAMVRLLAVFLLGFGIFCNSSEKSEELNPSLAKGKNLFEMNCAACHGLNGEGSGPAVEKLKIQPGNLKTFSNPPDMNKIIAAILDGNESKGMPSWNDLLTSKEVKQIGAYVVYLSTMREKTVQEKNGKKKKRKKANGDQ